MVGLVIITLGGEWLKTSSKELLATMIVGGLFVLKSYWDVSPMMMLCDQFFKQLASHYISSPSLVSKAILKFQLFDLKINFTK